MKLIARTNGPRRFDFVIDPKGLGEEVNFVEKDDLINKIGFKNYKSDLRPTGPGDNHRQWIWVQTEK